MSNVTAESVMRGCFAGEPPTTVFPLPTIGLKAGRAGDQNLVVT
jgi:hypothetical protein